MRLSRRGRNLLWAVIATVLGVPLWAHEFGESGESGEEFPAPLHVAANGLPVGFVDEEVLGGLMISTSVSFAADGSVFVAEKSGLINRFDTVDDTTPTVVGDLRPNVSDWGDRGLMGFQLAPGFPADPRAYVLYAALGRVDQTIPTGPECSTDPCIQSGMLSRLDWNGSSFSETQ
ncbi:MAG TPA: PQQ-dependent sugar dehydrogenase, partial [Microthrixaceae bacterium]|nr:PQQ-dependent sugar dehydrogenase [Microthrixaceae bacterium]